MGFGRIIGFTAGSAAGVGVLAAGAPAIGAGVNFVAGALGLGSSTAVAAGIVSAGKTILGAVPFLKGLGTAIVGATGPTSFLVATAGLSTAAASLVVGLGVVAAAFAVKAVFERMGDSMDAGAQKRQYYNQAVQANQPQLEQMKAQTVARQQQIAAEQKLAKQGQKMERQTQKQYGKVQQGYQNMQQQQQQTNQSYNQAIQAKRQATAPYYGGPSHHNNYQPQQQQHGGHSAPPAPNYQQGPDRGGYQQPQQPYYPPPPAPQGRPAHDFQNIPNHPGANNNGSHFQNMEKQRRNAPAQGVAGQIPMV